MSSVHNPFTVVQLRNGEVRIQELAWPDALYFYRRLTEQSKNLINEKGDIVLDAQKLIGAITENIELAGWLALKATGKDEAWLKERSVSEVLDIVTEAAAVNLGVIFEQIKNARSRLRNLIAGEAPKT